MKIDTFYHEDFLDKNQLEFVTLYFDYPEFGPGKIKKIRV